MLLFNHSGFQSIVRHSVNRSTSEPDDTGDDGNDGDEKEDIRDSGEAQDQDSPSDNQTLIRLLEPQEKVLHSAFHFNPLFCFPCEIKYSFWTLFFSPVF